MNYRLRDATFSRQRYWGEPFPVYYKGDMPYMIPQECLPLELPEVDNYQPTATGEPPLGNAKAWAWDEKARQVVDKSLVDGGAGVPLRAEHHAWFRWLRRPISCAIWTLTTTMHW